MQSTEQKSEHELRLSDMIQTFRTAVGHGWRHRAQLIRITLVAGVIGVLVAFGSPEEFTARMRVLPNRGAGASGGIMGLAGLAGIRLPAASAQQLITTDLYPDLASSLDFRIRVAETPLRFTFMSERRSMLEYFRDKSQPTVTEVLKRWTFDVPPRLLAGIRRAGHTQSRIQKSDTTDLPIFTSSYLASVARVGERVAISTDKRSGILTISATMPDPVAAADLARVSTDQLMELIKEFESRKAAEQYQFVQTQYEHAKDRYERTQRALAGFADRNRALMSATAQIERDRLQRDYDLAFEVFQQLSREREEAHLRLNQDVPVFAVFEKAIVPNNRSSPHRLRIVCLALFFGFLMGCGSLVLRPVLEADGSTAGTLPTPV